MPVHFNGNVTVNGNVEINGDGNVRITNSQIELKVDELKHFIERELPYSPNKNAYLEAANTIQNSKDTNIIKNALYVIHNMSLELGKTLLISGFSEFGRRAAQEIANKIVE